MEILSKREIKKLLKHYGINYDSNYVFINKKNKIYMVSEKFKEFKPEDFKKIISSGVYIGKIEKQGFRLTIEGSQFFKPKENILEINDLEWLEGKDILSEKKFIGFVAIKYKNDFLGSGLYSKGKILNFVPKVRRI